MNNYTLVKFGNKSIKSINPTVSVGGNSVSAISPQQTKRPNNKIATLDLKKVAVNLENTGEVNIPFRK